MSTKFQPLEIPPGVVTKPTKNMRSSNWSEVNLVRWIEGELQPVGGQSRYNYTFASRCKVIHPWIDLLGNLHIAYVCERNVYVDTGGALIEITPTGGWPAPPTPGQGGYGDLNYGDDTYGTPRASGTILPINQLPNAWTADNFGQILLVMYSQDGRLLEWDPSAVAGTLLTPTANAPHGRTFVVTQERFVMIFGMYQDGTVDGGSARRFGWCDQENRTAWNFSTVTSQAGFLDIEPSSPIVCAESGRFGTLFFTGKKAYISRYIGLPYIYNYIELADDCTPYSPTSIVATSSYVLWMGPQGMFAFDGTSITALPCLVRPWITDQIDPVNAREQACAVHVYRFNEFWWFFPTLANSPYNSLCVIFNYKEQWWSQGRMSRSAGIVGSYLTLPIMADGTIAIQHEMPPQYTQTYVNADPPWAETFDLNLTSGVRLVTLKQVMPDLGGDVTNVQFAFWAGMSRAQGMTGAWGLPVQQRNDGYVDARITGRDVRMRISTVRSLIQPFTVGQHLVDFAVRGDR